MKTKMKFTAVFEAAEEGGFTAYIEEIPGAISQGETLIEARANILDDLKLLIDARRERALDDQSNHFVIKEDLEFI